MREKRKPRSRFADLMIAATAPTGDGPVTITVLVSVMNVLPMGAIY
jgi:hypothetical protein